MRYEYYVLDYTWLLPIVLGVGMALCIAAALKIAERVGRIKLVLHSARVRMPRSQDQDHAASCAMEPGAHDASS